MLVVLEGIDNTGKSTLIKELGAKFNFHATKEPGSPLVPLNQEIRKMVLGNKSLTAFERELLFYVDASAHKRAIESHAAVVISDRGLWSHYAYAYGTLKTKQMDYEEYTICKHLIKQVCAAPDAIIYIQGDVELMKARQTQPDDVIESNGKEFYSYVLAQYDDLLIKTALESTPVLKLNARDSIEVNVAKSYVFIAGLQKLKF